MKANESSARGYLNPGYAASLKEFGQPRHLPSSQGWILTRAIPGSNERDALHCYPLFLCEQWSRLSEDLEAVHDLVTLTLVTDPFAEADFARLERLFPDRCAPYKDHFIVDLAEPKTTAHHRRKVRHAAQEVEVERCDRPAEWLDDFARLYAELVARKRIQGLRAFSRSAFETQLALPGCFTFGARRHERLVSIAIWYVMGSVAYYHLGASDADGYATSAPYALFDAAMKEFGALGLRHASLGAGTAGDDGLTRFKAGWATGTRPVFLCGRVFRREQYAQLNAAATNTGYFPAYRHGEFA